MHPLAASLERSPELFPHSLNVEADVVNLVRLTEADYVRASFLDNRVLSRISIARPIALSELELAVADTALAEQCSYIFHIGHVGSTLLSRLLGAHPGVFALREPAILRTLAQMWAHAEAEPRVWGKEEFERRLACFLKLWSRIFSAGEQANIKATSFVSEVAAELLARPAAPKAILIFVPAETYLASIFAGPNSRQESRILAESRLKRLHRRIGEERWHLRRLSEGETIAMSWACEMMALAVAANSAKARVLWLNFESFLQQPAASLSSALRHFGVEPQEAEIDTIISGAEMQRYSKAPEHPYEATLRRNVLNQARNEHASEVSLGLAWLDRAATQFSAIPRPAGPV
jgi:hypothetical protein